MEITEAIAAILIKKWRDCAGGEMARVEQVRVDVVNPLGEEPIDAAVEQPLIGFGEIGN
jgi:hypothetical protein